MKLRQRQLVVVLALGSALAVACGSDVKTGPDNGSSGNTSQSAGAPGDDEAGSSGAATGSAGSHSKGGAPAGGGSPAGGSTSTTGGAHAGGSSGAKTGTVKLNLKVK